MIKIAINKQRGFTLIELIVVIALVGIISGVIALTIGMVTRITSITTPRNMLISQVHLAGSWISGDIHSSTTITPGTIGTWGCSMERYQWNGTSFDYIKVDYTIADGVMTRAISKKDVNGVWQPDSQQEVARYISGPGTATTFAGPTASNTYMLTVSAVYGSENISQFYKIIGRSQ